VKISIFARVFSHSHAGLQDKETYCISEISHEPKVVQFGSIDTDLQTVQITPIYTKTKAGTWTKNNINNPAKVKHIGNSSSAVKKKPTTTASQRHLQIFRGKVGEIQ